MFKRFYRNTIGRAINVGLPRGQGAFANSKMRSNLVKPSANLKASRKPQLRTWIKEGKVHEHGKITVNQNYDAFIKKMDPANWSLNLPQRWGGKVIRMQDGRRNGIGTVHQQERMSLGRMAPMDMTKNTVVDVSKSRARVQWQVTHSDKTALTLGHKTVKQDDGWIQFSRTADNKVLVETRSVHDISTLPTHLISKAGGKVITRKFAGKMVDKLHNFGMKTFWKATLKNYQAIGEGRRKVYQPKAGELLLPGQL